MRIPDRTSPADLGRSVALFGLLGSLLLHGGCLFLGRSARGYALIGCDAIGTPGKATADRVRLTGRFPFSTTRGRLIWFYRDGRLQGSARIDREGLAEISFTPKRAGDTRFVAEYAHEGPEPVYAEVLICCRSAETPIAVVVVDRILTAPGTGTIFRDGARPAESSVSVMNRLAQRYTVLYLTHHPAARAARGKAWLRECGYPPGPVMRWASAESASDGAAPVGSGLGRIRAHFRGRGIGISDRIPGAQACSARGLEAFVILLHPEPDDPGELRRLAEALEALHPAVQVVQNWKQIEQVVFSGADCPRPAAQRRLRGKAERLGNP